MHWYYHWATSEPRTVRRLSKKIELRIALMLAMALLLAQFGAQAHAYSHLHSGTDTTYQLDAHGKLCADCLSFAPLLSTAGSPAQPLVVELQRVELAPSVEVDSQISRFFTPAFRSRAPPTR
jgi:hypothetical protein